MGCPPRIIDYDYLDTPVNITAGSFAVTELLRVVVPSLPYAVELFADLYVARSSGAATVGASLAIVPAAALASNPLLSALNSDRLHGLTSPAGTYLGVKAQVTAYVAKNSPGEYVLGGTNLAGGDVAQVNASNLTRAQLFARH